ncbi:MAG: KR domain-containing protein [Chitinophagaceae bacterium]
MAGATPLYRPGRVRAGPQVALRSRTATYLVTGAFGGLGGVVARWLVERVSARHVALLGRRAEAGTDVAAALWRRGVRVVQVIRADVGDEVEPGTDALAIDLPDSGAAAARHPARRGRPVRRAHRGLCSRAQVEAMMRPKLNGTLAARAD